MSRIGVVVIGTSAGGVEALKNLFRCLPPEFKLPIVVVQHFPENAKTVLPQILAKAGGRNFKLAQHGEALKSSWVYVAPPGYHALIQEGKIRLARGPKENACRPAIDPLFRTAAQCYGNRTCGVLLSGMLSDGTIGMAAIKRRGGYTIVQDLEQATYSDMPRHALEQVEIDYIGATEAIAQRLCDLAEGEDGNMDCEEDPKDPVEMDAEELKMVEENGAISAFTCPECHGTLFEMAENGMSYFRCRVGHAYSEEKLLQEQLNGLETALWVALRALEENNDLLRRMESRAREKSRDKSADYFAQKLSFNSNQIKLLRDTLGLELRSAVPFEQHEA